MAVGGSLTAVGAAYLDEHAFAAGARGGSDDLARGCGDDVLRREVDDAAQRHERRPVNGTYQGGKPYKKVWQTRYLSSARPRFEPWTCGGFLHPRVPRRRRRHKRCAPRIEPLLLLIRKQALVNLQLALSAFACDFELTGLAPRPRSISAILEPVNFPVFSLSPF